MCGCVNKTDVYTGIFMAITNGFKHLTENDREEEGQREKLSFIAFNRKNIDHLFKHHKLTGKHCTNFIYSTPLSPPNDKNNEKHFKMEKFSCSMYFYSETSADKQHQQREQQQQRY